MAPVAVSVVTLLCGERPCLDVVRQARGINLVVHSAPYSRQVIVKAAELIFSNAARLARLGFDLQSVGGPTSRFLGLTVRGAVVGDAYGRVVLY